MQETFLFLVGAWGAAQVSLLFKSITEVLITGDWAPDGPRFPYVVMQGSSGSGLLEAHRCCWKESLRLLRQLMSHLH